MVAIPNCLPFNPAQGSYSGNGTITVPANAAGNSGFFGFTNESSSATNFITVSGGGTWTRVDSISQGSTALEVWYLQNATGSSTSFTITTSVAGKYVYCESAGVLASSPFDTSTKASVSSSSWSLSTGSTGTVSNPVELIIEVDCQLNGGKGGSSSTPSGYTQIATTGSGASHIYMNYKVRMAALSSESATITGGSASPSTVMTILSCFKLAANVIQQNLNNIVTGTSTSISIAAPYPGNLQILCADNTSGGASTVTQTNAVWTRLQSSATNAITELWYSSNASASAGTTITTGNGCAVVYSEWFGGAASLTLDKSVTQTGSMTTATTNMVTGTTPTNSNAPQVVIASLGGNINGKSGTWSAPLNGFTLIKNTTAGGKSVNCLYNILTSATTISTGATLTPTLNTDGYGTVLATFQETTATEQPSLMMMGTGSL